MDYNIQEQSLDLLDISKFVPQANLTAYKNSDTGKLERMMNLPKSIRDQGMDEFLANKEKMGYKSILDVMNPIVNESIERPIIIDRSFLENFAPISYMQNKRNAIDEMASHLNRK